MNRLCLIHLIQFGYGLAGFVKYEAGWSWTCLAFAMASASMAVYRLE